MFKKITAAILLFGLFSQESSACTLWASLGASNKTAQLLFVKNRDAPPAAIQRLQFLKPVKGYAYLALMYKDQPTDARFSYLSAGINQQGLNIADNAIHTAATFPYAAGSDLMQEILANYSTVEEVLKAKDRLFTRGAGQNFMIADAKQILMVEIAPAGHYAIDQVSTSGYLFHTNHYLNTALIPYNDPVSTSTFVRYNHINQWLTTSPAFTQAMFENFARDQSVHTTDDQVDTNLNILRKWTVATWIVSIPVTGPPTLHLQEFNPNQPKADNTYVLDQAFWQHKH